MMVANALGYHSIGSDINVSSCKQNLKRRKTTDIFQDKKITEFKHDVRDPFTKPFLSQVDVIVTEGRLGPVLKDRQRHRKQELEMLEKNKGEIVKLYTEFLQQIYSSAMKVPIVITLPVYLKHDIDIA